MPWHTQRARIAEIAAALGVVAGAAAKPALDIVLLAQSEVAEVRERDPDRGGSSAMPQKRNPIAAVSARAAAAQAPGLVAIVLGAMAQEHERAAGAWHAEWRPLRGLFVTVGSAVAWLAEALADIDVDVAAMGSNLTLGGGALLAERVAAELSPLLGRDAAEALVAAASRSAVDAGSSFETALSARIAESPELAAVDLGQLLDPSDYLGSAGALVDRAIAAHAALGNRS
jgi:3-carboxy-cis,cis-muconate cycloisomerase